MRRLGGQTVDPDDEIWPVRPPVAGGTTISTGGFSTGGFSTGEFATGEFATGEFSTGEFSTGEFSAGEISAGQIFQRYLMAVADPQTCGQQANLCGARFLLLCCSCAFANCLETAFPASVLAVSSRFACWHTCLPEATLVHEFGCTC